MSFFSESPRIEMDKSDLRVNVALGSFTTPDSFDLDEKNGLIWLTAAIEPRTIACNTQPGILTHYAVILQPLQSLYHKNDIVAAGDP